MATPTQPLTQEQLANQALLKAAAAYRAAPHELPAATPGVDPFDFVTHDRIHIKDGSLFVDAYLAIHPHELAPENEAKLKQKLALTYSVNNPSFYEDNARRAVALNLGQLIPVSLQAKNSKINGLITSYNNQVDSGTDAELQKLTYDKEHPFAAIVRDTLEKPTNDPMEVEARRNGLSLYLLVREKLTSMGYRNSLTSYVTKSGTPDQVLTDLGAKIGVTPLQVRDAALKGGVAGVGQLLGLDPAYVKDVEKFTAYAAGQEFSLNAIEHWHQGRHLLGINAPLEQKMAAGMTKRIAQTIARAREQVHHIYEVAEPIKHEEKRIAEALNLVEPVQRAVMFKLGYEIGYTPEAMADGIAFYQGVYGLHRKAANDLRDTRGTYHIYFAGRGDLKASMRTMVHEIAHNLWPELFSAEEVTKIDQLIKSDAERFVKLNQFMDEKFLQFSNALDAFKATPDDQKLNFVQKINEEYKEYGNIGDVLPYIRDAHDFLYMVRHAGDTLQIEGSRYAKSGYNSPHERFREVISRFAELKQVEYRSEPQLLHLLAPGLDQVWEAHYIPHLHRLNAILDKTPAQQGAAPKPTKVTVSTNDVAASSETLPKVEQRPNPEPVTPAPAAPAPTMQASPDTFINTDEAAHQGMALARANAQLEAQQSMFVQR